MATRKNRSVKGNGIPVYNSDGKEVGEIFDGCLVKHVRYSKHFYKKWGGWTWDKPIIEKAIELGAVSIKIIDDEKRKEYRVTMADFQQHSKPFQYPGYGEQLCLPLCFWEEISLSKKPRRRSDNLSPIAPFA